MRPLHISLVKMMPQISDDAYMEVYINIFEGYVVWSKSRFLLLK